MPRIEAAGIEATTPGTLEPPTPDKLLIKLAGISENTPQEAQEVLATIWENDLFRVKKMPRTSARD